MRWVLAVLVLAQSDPLGEHKSMLARIHKNAAAKHFSVGDYLATAQMREDGR
jgi:hypothetical protein